MDRRYLTTIAANYCGGPVGVETLAAALSEPRDAIEDIIEPYLIQCGLLQRTPRGRLITGHAFRHLGLPEPARDPAQFGLFGRETASNFCLQAMERPPTGAMYALVTFSLTCVSDCETIIKMYGSPTGLRLRQAR